MADEVRITDHDVTVGDHDQDLRVTDWEAGLPDSADLPPLSQMLISPELASAFSISPEPHRSFIDVDRASRDTISSLRGQSQLSMINKTINMNKMNDLRCGFDDRDEEMVVDGDGESSPERKFRRLGGGGDDGGGDGGGGGGEEAESARMNNNNNNNNNNNKRVRLVWTPQLHKRFVEVVAHLGVKNAVPKTIMQLMNVEGLTRENVASHLQKYRLYLKRMQGGLGNEGTSCSDNLFDSTPDPKSLRESDGPVNMPYPQQMVPIPYPMPQIVPSGSGGGGGGYNHGFEYHSHPYNMMMQPKEWSGNNVGSVLPYQHSMTQNHK